MDPLSISMACIGLGELMFKASKAAASFVCDVRSAQADIDAINKEFECIRLTINLLSDEFLERTPGHLRDKISAVVANCASITDEIHQVLSIYQPPLGVKSLRWASSGKNELEKLKSNLSTHRLALDIALDTVKLVVIGDVKDHTIDIKRILQDGLFQILRKVDRVDRRLHRHGDSKSIRLQKWLDEMSWYAGSVVTSIEPNTAELRKRYGVSPDPLPTSFQLRPSVNRGLGTIPSVRSDDEEEDDDDVVLGAPDSASMKRSDSVDNGHPNETESESPRDLAADLLVTTETTRYPEDVPSLSRSQSPTPSCLSLTPSWVSPRKRRRSFLRRVYRKHKHGDALTSKESRVGSVSTTSPPPSRGSSLDGYPRVVRDRKRDRLFKGVGWRSRARLEVHQGSSISIPSISPAPSFGSSSTTNRAELEGEHYHRKRRRLLRLVKRHHKRSTESVWPSRSPSVNSFAQMGDDIQPSRHRKMINKLKRLRSKKGGRGLPMGSDGSE